MTIMIAKYAEPLWCPHPSWGISSTTIERDEAIVYVHCQRCGAGQELHIPQAHATPARAAERPVGMFDGMEVGA